MSKYLESHEVCDTLHISRRTLRRLIDRGEFAKPVLIGRKQLWDEDTLKSWLAAGGSVNNGRQTA